MSPDELKKLLQQVKDGNLEVDKALNELKELPFKNLGHTMVDSHRELRTGYPEVIFCAGKTVEQVVQIMEYMITRDNNVLGTRATEEMYNAVKGIAPEAVFNKLARTITIKRKEYKIPESYISVVTAGTSDIPVAEEAAITAEIFGNRVERIFDVGVAGIHRLHGNMTRIADARIIIVVAGMEGALPSVVGGMVDKPIIAVPTSVGYGANFQGLSALLGMLTSCASGVTVVNIDNGFGAGYFSSMINKI
ncbi:MAG: nickel pincer cofactor biosynthesis protein LarB [Bacteroidales bacterium]|nr:nickel pincer cofactor biosynthesis protein LarB [Bacteroidales bacterium]